MQSQQQTQNTNRELKQPEEKKQSEQEQKKNDIYSSYVGLNTNEDDFEKYVMRHNEIKSFFANNQQYKAPFVYPMLVADGFKVPVIFSAENMNDNAFILKAEIESNDHPKTCAGKLASFFLPKTYQMYDQIQFDSESKNDDGIFHITSQKAVRLLQLSIPTGFFSCQLRVPSKPISDPFLACMLGVKNRPGLFLKVAKSDGGFYDDVAIFFPDKAEGITHKPVQYGEAFVLVKQNIEPDTKLRADIKNTFDKLVKNSYGNEGGLYTVLTHELLEDPKNRAISTLR